MFHLLSQELLVLYITFADWSGPIMCNIVSIISIFLIAVLPSRFCSPFGIFVLSTVLGFRRF